MKKYGNIRELCELKLWIKFKKKKSSKIFSIKIHNIHIYTIKIN